MCFQTDDRRNLRLLALRLLFAGLFIFTLIFTGPAADAQSLKNSAADLPTLTTAASVHSLSTAEASRSYPVHLRGVVTCIDPSTSVGYAAMFIHDATGSVYVLAELTKPAFPAGTVVDVVGVSGPGTAAPIVNHTRIEAVGHSPLPPNPPLQDLFHLETGDEDGKWVEVEGTVHSVFVHDRGESAYKYITLQLAMVGGTVTVSMLWEADVDYSALIDANVKIRGNAAPLFNSNDQVIGARLMTPGIATVEVVEAAPDDPFKQPITLIDNLLRWNQKSTSLHRVHLRGNVTLQWPGSSLCIRDSSRGICVETVQDTQLALGEIVDVVGFAQAENGTTVLTDAVFRSAGQGKPVAAKPVTAEQALLAKDDSGLVQIEGQLINSNLTSSDLTLLLASGKLIFTAILPRSLAGAEAGKWKIGSRLRVTGICSLRLDVQSSEVGRGIAVAKSFRILMRSTGDVIVLQRPSWWTPGHGLSVLGILFAAVLGAFAWITRLRRSVRTQTAALQKAREEFAAINELAQAMQVVAAERNLTARVSATGSEQIAQLGIGFNRMLSELEEGDLAKRRAEAQLQYQALTDELTGLPNRRSLSERLKQGLAMTQREQRVLAVLFIDLDGFKAVNDTLGHAAGDLLLVEVARRLSSRIRQTDTLARLGGDEFTILLNMLHEAKEADLVAASILEILSERFVLEGQDITIGASIGISLFPQDGTDPVTLLQQADSAMYVAKGSGKNRVHCYTPELGSSVRERLSLESQLRGAILRDEIHLHYQPEFDLATRRVTRFEALARWTHPILGSIPPGKFIPVAEDSGQIVALGAYVLQEACREALKWQAIASWPIQVAVNVSSLQFSRATFVDEIQLILRDTGLKPQLLQIELAESIMLIGAERVAESMNRLRALGISLAIDDFGTGYSCLSYLSLLPFDTLKIDRSFVHALTSRSGAKAIVSFLIALAHSLNMQVVVEGVETPQQLEIIKQLNGNDVQGFLMGRPTADPQLLLHGGEGLMTHSADWIPEAV